MQHHMYQSFLMLSSYYKVTQKDLVFYKKWLDAFIYFSKLLKPAIFRFSPEFVEDRGLLVVWGKLGGF